MVLRSYRGLVPFTLMTVTLEQVLRVLIGLFKPVVSAHTPPGALSKILLPIVLVAMYFSLTRRRTRRT